jgi:predicted TIM-barrel fold metal-dependent hydrolase
MDPIWDLAAELGLAVLCHSDATDLRKVLEKRPHAKMLAAHMSSQYKEKAELARDYPNVVLEISGAGAGPEDIIRAVEIAGPENLVFGSDLNTHALNYTLRPVLCSGLPEATLRAILRENAIRFFGL